MRILVTAGGTQEPLDEVRFLTNFSTGRTGAILTETWTAAGHHVTHLCGRTAIPPSNSFELQRYGSFADLNSQLQAILGAEPFDLVVHAAAVSDYSISEIRAGERTYPPGSTGKIDSSAEELVLKLKRNYKILDRLKGYAAGHPIVVGFKLTNTPSRSEREQAIFKLSLNPAIDFVVHNDYSEILESGQQPFSIFRQQNLLQRSDSASKLAQALAKLGEHA